MKLERLRELGKNGPHLVEEPWIYSASQLALFDGCPMKWFLEYVLGYPRPETRSQAIGKAVHAEVEKNILGEAEASDPKALLLLEQLEGSGLSERSGYKDHHLRVEHKVLFRIRKGDRQSPWFKGFIDLLEWWDGDVTITDHKTTSDLKWAKTEYELRKDIQMVSYAYWAWTFLETRSVYVQHNVVTTKGAPQVRLTGADMPRDHVEKRWARHLQIIDEMEDCRGFNVKEVDTKGTRTGECEKYGGCPHRSECTAVQLGRDLPMFTPPDAPPTEEQEQKQEPKEKKMSKMLDKLKNLKKETPPAKKTRSKKGTAKKTAPKSEAVEAPEVEEESEAAPEAPPKTMKKSAFQKLKEAKAKAAAAEANRKLKKQSSQEAVKEQKARTAAKAKLQEAEPEEAQDGAQAAEPATPTKKTRSKKNTAKVDVEVSVSGLPATPADVALAIADQNFDKGQLRNLALALMGSGHYEVGSVDVDMNTLTITCYRKGS